jgi:hypothetical protein
MSLEVSKMIYYSYVHSATSYTTIFWGNSHFSESRFKIQKTIIIFIKNTARRESCCELYKKLQILTPPSLYIFSLLVFVIKNRSCFLINFEIDNISTCHKHNLHLPSTNLTLVQKGVLFSGSKIYNHLPFNIKKVFEDAKRLNSTLALDEYYQITSQ